ncbi:hypothetical protein BV881_18320 [Streptomyces sp. ZL-24]|nr:hypothetical protein BV881_18320 [Streptomyces sp. ZL-24]
MGYARACSVALVGVEGVVVEVQADLEPGVAAFTLVGLPDKSLIESRDRVRAAVTFPVKFCVSAPSPLGSRARRSGSPSFECPPPEGRIPCSSDLAADSVAVEARGSRRDSVQGGL